MHMLVKCKVFAGNNECGESNHVAVALVKIPFVEIMETENGCCLDGCYIETKNSVYDFIRTG